MATRRRAYGSAAKTDPTGPSQGSFHVLRGGSFVSDAANLRAADRYSTKPPVRSKKIGFRCARTL